MSLLLLAFLAFLPILVAGIMLVGFRIPAKIAMPVVLGVTVVISWLVWDFSLLNIAASSIQGLFITFDILWIIFGAILLLVAAFNLIGDGLRDLLDPRLKR